MRRMFLLLLLVGCQQQLHLQEVFPLPKPEKLDVTILNTYHFPDSKLLRLDIRIPSSHAIINNNEQLRLDIPCYLFVHNDTTARPGILIIPGNGPGRISTAGIVEDYENSSALFLAEHGFVVITCDTVGAGDYGLALLERNNSRGQSNAMILSPTSLPGLFQHTSLMSMILADQQRSLQVLKQVPHVTRIGAGGASQGGFTALTLAALTTDIDSVVVMSWLRRFQEIKGDDNSAWWAFPGMGTTARMKDIASAIAPRPALYVNGENDPSATPAEAEEVLKEVRPSYGSLGAANNLSSAATNAGHEWNNELALEFFRRTLLRE